MRVIFLCSALEPGKDGVGDYTRLLASELIKSQGCSAAIIALNDKNIANKFIGFQDIKDEKVEVLRLPSTATIQSRISEAKEFIDKFKPNWISLQYVPYGFNDKGIARGWPEALSALTAGRKVNIMFHELWIGISVISPFKHKIIGSLQRRIAKKLIAKLKPELVLTSNLLYKLVLNTIKTEALVLPLFGNIPVAPQNSLYRESIFKKMGITENEKSTTYLIGIFGNLYPGAGLEKILSDLLLKENIKNKQVYFLGFGNINAQGLDEFNRLSLLFANKIKFLHLGIGNENEVSNLLQMLDIGISSTPSQHIGKSGVFANMKLHGLEVILPEGDIIPEYDSQIKEYNQLLIDKKSDNWSVEFVANMYYKLLLEKSGLNRKN